MRTGSVARAGAGGGRTARGGAVVALVASLFGAAVAVAPPAAAFVLVNAAPSFPAGTVVGQTFPAAVGLSNASTPPESVQFPVLTMSSIDLYPSCTVASTDCGGGTAETGVYALSPTGTGQGPPTCVGTWTITEASPGRWRFTPPGGEASLQIATGDTCAVNFTGTTRRVPTSDADVSPGIQTLQVLSATPTAPGPPPFGRPTGVGSSTVTKATPGLSTAAASTPPQGESPPAVPATTTDTATIGTPPPPSSASGVSPTGSATFTLFGPDNATCSGSPTFTNTVVVSGFGSYPTSSAASVTSPGVYRWVATYSGDANYSGSTTACGDPAEAVTFGRALPQLVTTAAPGGSVGQPITDTATLSAGLNPTGTITFTLFGPDNATCSGSPTFTSTVVVSGNGSSTSAPFTPTAAGTYRWVATYSGDANNNPAMTLCGDPGEMSVVSRVQPQMATQAPPTASLGQPFADTATISGGLNPTGTMTFTLFGPNNATCTGSPAFSSTKAVAGNGNYTSDPFTPTQPGSYRWVAAYSGDANNQPITTGCGDVNETTTVTGRRSPADFEGDGKSDVAVFRPSNGAWYVNRSAGGTTSVVWGASGDYPVSGDFDGDGKADEAVFRLSTGTWFVRQSSGGSTATVWGDNGDIPVPADYDGDGRTDLAVFRPSTSVWYVSRSSGGSVAVAWGASGDFPLAGDYDGDGQADLAVFRSSTGTWYVKNSSGGGTATAWGVSGDVPVAGDFDGDGKADVTVWRPSNGTWYSSLSAGGSLAVAWGVSGDRPVAGDYDGDGKTDLTVFRYSAATWFRSLSGGGNNTVFWGTTGDITIPPPAA